MIQTYQTDPFGVPTASQGNVSQPFQFTGPQYDANGLLYLRARLYDPVVGRFLSRDPLFGAITSPLSLNRYSYAENNPVDRDDPSGLASETPSVDVGPGSVGPAPDPTSPGGADDRNCLDPTSRFNCFLPTVGPGGTLVVGALKDWCGALPFLCPETGGGGGKGTRGPRKVPPTPGGMSFAEFGQKVMKWGRGDAQARARIATITREELEQAGVTEGMAAGWRDFYRDEVKINPSNPSAAGRADLMQYVVEILGGGK